MKAPLALTTGEPAGIGPDLAVAWAQSRRDVSVVAVADPDLLRSRAEQLGLDLALVEYPGPVTRAAGSLSVQAVWSGVNAVAGRLDVRNVPFVLETLTAAADGCIEGTFSGMVTGPVQKSVINDAGIAFSGHTEFLAERCGSASVVMLLVAGDLRVALATTHVSLAEVPALITRNRLTDVLEVLLGDLKTRFGIARPRVLVAGLNPHAGEGGHLGREEIDVIAPVCRSFADRGVIGPLPADTLFTQRQLAGADAVLAMYHDQGLPVLKHVGFGNAVNVTLGLPIVRTSVDHGTALDLAGRGGADIGSFVAAIELADKLARS
ncbi:MAG TPA: 4-hydroxythreonine-4-phosphate dehydrogenase PdxA [Pseudomonadales bacterium]|nr:4-hydroxythreonine-4-phosphate dehydrogenase PdxA [Pseudomonadales bacterium]